MGQSVRLQDITPESLEQVDRAWETSRLRGLTKTELVAIGRNVRLARMNTNHLEIRTKLRVMKCYQMGFSVEELAELLGLDRKEIRRWVKGIEQ